MASIISVDDFYTLDDSPSPPHNPDQIANAILVATAKIENLCGRVFEIAPSPASVVETLNGNGSCRIYTKQAPVTAVTKIEYWDGTTWQEYELTMYPYTFKADSNIIYFTEGHRFDRGFQNIRVTFTYGYDAFPDDLQWACFIFAKHAIFSANKHGFAQQSDGEQNFQYRDDKAALEAAMAVVLRYKTVW
jgi:hypothetical protein